MPAQRQRFRLGAYLVSPRTGYTHHGIYVGRNKVIHYSGLADGLQAGPVEITTLDSFDAGMGVSVVSYSQSTFTGQEIVRRAKSRLGENCYDLQMNNCEHFCTWAVTGSAASDQVSIVEGLLEDALPNSFVTMVVKTRRRAKEADTPAEAVGRITEELIRWMKK